MGAMDAVGLLVGDDVDVGDPVGDIDEGIVEVVVGV